jgi:Zn finger protein HypA/HybF involved in hydrogenase expression
MSDEPNKCICANCGYAWYEYSNCSECDYCTEERIDLEDEEALAAKEWAEREMLDFD